MKRPPKEHFKQAKVYSAGLATIRKWTDRAGRFAISEVKSKLTATRYLLIEISRDGSEGIVGRNKTLKAAVAAWEGRQ